jgi:hypothetical protein
MDVTIARPILMMREPWETSISACSVDEIYLKSSFVNDFIKGVQNGARLKLDEIYVCMKTILL